MKYILPIKNKQHKVNNALDIASKVYSLKVDDLLNKCMGFVSEINRLNIIESNQSQNSKCLQNTYGCLRFISQYARAQIIELLNQFILRRQTYQEGKN